MDTLLFLLSAILVVLFFACLAIPFLLIRKMAWPETRQGRTDAILASLAVALCAIIHFVAGTIVSSEYAWCVMAVIPGAFYGAAIVGRAPAGMRRTFFKAIGFCLQALIAMLAVMDFVAMTAGGQENAPRLSHDLFFQELWIIAFMVGAAAPYFIDIKRKGKS